MIYQREFNVSLSIALLLVANGSVYGQRRGGYSGGRAGGAHVAGAYGGGSTGGYNLNRGGLSNQGGGSREFNTGSGSHTTQRGGTIEWAGAGGKGTGAGGGKGAGGIYGIEGTTAGGKSYEHVGHAGGVVGPGGYSAAGRGGTTRVEGAQGSAMTHSQGRIASGPEGVAGERSRAGIATGEQGTVAGRSRAGFASGERGTVAGAERGGVAAGNEGAVAGRERAGFATGAGGAVAGGSRSAFASGQAGWAHYTSRWGAAGYGTHYAAGGAVHAQAGYVRTGFVHYNSFNSAWFSAHPAAWRPAGWNTATFWTPATYAAIAPVLALPAQPITYDYGSTVTYEGDQVYSQGEPVATADTYTQQAADIAARAQQAKSDDKAEWTPLGVFGLVQGEETNANNIFQLAINRDGVVAGNYYDALSDTTLPVHGSLDKQSQRVAWNAGDNKETVYETGIENLTQPETQILVHFGKSRTQQWTLVRLEKPEGQAGE
jgi:hypothetical protein